MEKQFVPYPPALRLKALGFDEPCFTYYHDGFLRFCLDGHNNVCERKNSSFMRSVSAPTYSQAFRWFREKHDINNCISYSRLEDNNWYYQYYKSGLDGGFETYEEAELACLEKLIELVEQKEK